jgi:hypothetical protein
MKIVERENDLTVRICSICSGQIAGKYGERSPLRGSREFYRIGPCERPENAGQTSEAKLQEVQR